jgi:Zn-dependent protease
MPGGDGIPTLSPVLRFSLGPIPIRIQPTVLLVGVYVWFVSRSVEAAVVWTSALVVAVLTHELGHAIVVRRVGSEPAVTVWALGGYTSWVPTPGIGWKQRFAISAAGSAMQLAVAATVWVLGAVGLLGPTIQAAFGANPFELGSLGGGPLVAFAAVVVYLGMVWSLFNWIPIPGLDGAHMLRAALGRVEAKAADRIVLVVGLVVAAAIAGWLLWRGERFLAVFVLVIAATGIR